MKIYGLSELEVAEAASAGKVFPTINENRETEASTSAEHTQSRMNGTPPDKNKNLKTIEDFGGKILAFFF